MKILMQKLREALLSVLPITAVILIINFAVRPMPDYNLIAFLIGAVLLILGMGLYTLGTDVAIEPMGGHIGSRITKTKKAGLILAVCFVIGVIVTVAEPDLQVLATQVPTIDNWVLILTVAAGVGVFLVFAILRIMLKINLNLVLIAFYVLLFVLAAFVDAEFIPLAFDSGGVTTGPMTVPFIMALGIGISAVLGGNSTQDNSFGIIGICSIGPILAVLILGLFNPQASAGAADVTVFGSVGEIFAAFGSRFLYELREVGIALLPIVAFFFIFQFIALKLPKAHLLKIVVGIVYTYVGLSIFLTGVNVGFMSAGVYIGEILAGTNRWLLIPVGMVVGAFIVLAEPAVHVLNKQVEEITGGTIRRSTMLKVLAVSMAAALGLSMLRVAAGVSIWWIILPGYAVALGLSFFVPKIFTAIAFDSGGVASGPMTATFLLPLAMGAVTELGGNIFTDAFGIVATVAMTPLVTIQVLGLIYKFRLIKAQKAATAEAEALLNEEGEVIDLMGDPVEIPALPAHKSKFYHLREEGERLIKERRKKIKKEWKRWTKK